MINSILLPWQPAEPKENGFAPKNAFTIRTKPNQENHTHFELLKIALGTELHITSYHLILKISLLFERGKKKKKDLLNKD